MTTRHFRLASGLVMLAYLSQHLVTHMLGIHSLALAEDGLRLSIRIWQSPLGTALLYGAFAIHFALALYTLYERRHWKLPVIEWIRLWAGFSLPLLLIGHAVGTRLAVALYGIQPSYTRTIEGLIHAGSQGWQVALLAPGWVHGCLGLWLTLRHLPVFVRARQVLLVLMLAMPLLSAVGFVQMSREIEARGLAPIQLSTVNAERVAHLKDWRMALLGGYWLLLAAAVLAGRWHHAAWRGPDDGDADDPAKARA